MGKRVNYAGRTVISPDPYLQVKIFFFQTFFISSPTFYGLKKKKNLPLFF
jgi:hypothetical protein